MKTGSKPKSNRAISRVSENEVLAQVRKIWIGWINGREPDIAWVNVRQWAISQGIPEKKLKRMYPGSSKEKLRTLEAFLFFSAKNR